MQSCDSVDIQFFTVDYHLSRLIIPLKIICELIKVIGLIFYYFKLTFNLMVFAIICLYLILILFQIVDVFKFNILTELLRLKLENSYPYKRFGNMVHIELMNDLLIANCKRLSCPAEVDFDDL